MFVYLDVQGEKKRRLRVCVVFYDCAVLQIHAEM